MMLKARDMRRKINGELKGKPEAEQVRIIERYVQGWPPNLRGEYVEIRRHLVRRLERMRTISRVRAATGAPPEDPFVVAKAGHLTALLVGLPNAGKSYLFHRLGGDGASIADYPFSTTIPAVHLAPLDNLRIQIVDLPPIDEGAVEGLPYGEKLRRMLGLADVLCVVLDASGDVELQELVLSEELSSLGVELQAESVLVLGNRASETADPDAPVPDTVLAGTRPLREGDFCTACRIAAAGGYLSPIAKPPCAEEADPWVERGATSPSTSTGSSPGLTGHGYGGVAELPGPPVGRTRRRGHSQGPGELSPSTWALGPARTWR